MSNALRFTIVIGAAVIAFAAGLGLQGLLSQRSASAPPDVPGLLWPVQASLEPFELIDHNGAMYNRDRLRGRWTLLFFGFTHCPDICPATMAVMDSAVDLASAEGLPADELQVVLVSVDPARDDPEQLARYVRHFDEDFLGVTGSHEALGKLTSQLGAVYTRPGPDAGADYSVDHTAALFLIDPLARRVGVFSAPHSAPDIAERLVAIRDFVEGA